MENEARSYAPEITAQVAIRDYSDEQGMIGGNTVALGAMDEKNAATFVNELDMFVQNMHPEIRNAFIMNAGLIWDTIRAVNMETRQGFDGMFARNKSLDFQMVIPEHIASGTHAWNVTIASVAAADWLASEASPVSVGEEEAYIFLGIADPVAQPLVTRVIFAKNSDALPQIHINWDNFENHVMLLKEPIVILPEETFYARKYDAVVGVDYIQPIGIKILMGKEILSNSFA